MDRLFKRLVSSLTGLFLLGSLSCSNAETAAFKLIEPSGKEQVLSTTRQGKPGILRPGSRFLYELEKPLMPAGNQAFSIRYTVHIKGADPAEDILTDSTLMVSLLQETPQNGAEQVQWQLPLSRAFLGFDNPGFVYTIRYVIPLNVYPISSFLIEYKSSPKRRNSSVTVMLEELRLVSLWFGFSIQDGTLACTPFVAPGPDSYMITVPEQYRGSGLWQVNLSAGSLNAPVLLQIGTKDTGGYGLVSSTIHPLAGGALPQEPFPISLSANNPYTSFVVSIYTLPPLLSKPIPADPASILDYRQELWRNQDYEVFQWDRFPEILIFDTQSYEVQDRLFKRLAFYVEKAGYRGRLASDAEIAPLHGWNAHDYRSKDLADFFNTAETTKFELNDKELQLRDILIGHGIIQKSPDGKKGYYIPGKGAIISISRESDTYLRRLFMVHEAFHGLFFIDPDFQAFALDRWTHLDPVAQTFLLAYFKNRGYDTGDTYLMKNELMAYCLQQPVSGASLYFGKTLPERLFAFPQYRNSIPEKDDKSATWPTLATIFTAEARAFSNYVAQRYGLEAGRVWDMKKSPL